ncbi:DUF6449 domain-containing protein [Gracilibacillus sp. D59]|uniref:DUF6449 domain-containing protein n=1 Tax=Gracilibacillus sp. D59 TaxID=3457434 RepID=UPI003FCE5784
MPSKTSYFKKEIWKQAFRSSGWIGIGYFLALLFVLPLQVIMVKTNPEQFNYYQDRADNLFYLNGEVQSILILTVPVLAAIFACRYMQVKDSADFIHSLPLKRAQLFYHQFFIGYMMVLIPVLVTGFILFIMYGLIDVDFIYQHEDIGNWLYDTLTLVTFMYSISYLIGNLSGISVVQGALSYIVIFFPSGISLLMIENLRMLLEGFSANYSAVLSYFTNISPIYWIFEISYQSNFEIVTWYYWVLSVVFVALSLILYRIRHIESANQAIAFSIMKPIFKFGVTICFMLLGGVYFGSIQGQYVGWIMFGYICGAILGYLLAEMVIQKTWRVFHQWKGFVIYFGISMLIVLSLIFDWYGFETIIPDEDEVEGIFFNGGGLVHTYDAEGNQVKPNITDPDLIQHVIDLHEYIVSYDQIGQRSDMMHTEIYTNIDIIYHLENSSKVTREYSIPVIKESEQYLQPILESDDYKKSSMPWLYQENDDVDRISVNGFNGSQEVTDQETINKIVAAFKKDYLEMTYDEMSQGYFKNRDSKTIEFELETRETKFLPLLDSYSRVLEVLKDEDLDRGIIITPEDVSMIAITNSQVNKEMFYELPQMEEIDSNNWMLVEKSEQIEELMKLNEDANGTWEVGIYGPMNDRLIRRFQVSEDQLPSYVKDYFE